MKKMLFALFATMVLTVGFAACQEKVPSYLVVEDVDEDYYDIRGKAIVGVTDPDDVPAHVKIPNGIVAIIDDAFEDCTSLKSVTIPKSVKVIDGGVFYDCEDIEVTYKGTLKDWCVGDWDYSLLKNAKSITLSDGTDLKKLTKIDASNLNGVTRIGCSAFEDCMLLKSVTIPKSVKEIDFDAFNGCTRLEVIYNGSLKDWCVGNWDYSLLENAKSITLSDGRDLKKLDKIDAGDLKGVTRIGYQAFRDCIWLESVVIPSTVTAIRSSAFDGCMDLKFQYDGTVAQWNTIDKGMNIGNFVVQCTDGEVSVE